MAQPIRGLIPDWFREINRSFLSGYTEIMLPKCELDEEYPHFCFKCKKQLKFNELKDVNESVPEKQLKKWWKSEAVEFYCCHCYIKETQLEDGYTADRWLLVSATYSGRVRGYRADEIIVDEAAFLDDMVIGQAIGVDYAENGQCIATVWLGD